MLQPRGLDICFYPVFVLLDQSNCIDWVIYFVIYTVTERNITFSGTCMTSMLHVELMEPSCISSSHSVDRKYHKG